MLFSQIVGQETIKKRLINTVVDNRVSHAQLFLGPEGYGGLPMAIAFAQYISCKNRTASDSCNACHSCIKFNKLAHPDLHFIFPVNTTKEVAKNPTSAKFIEKWRKTVLDNPYMSLGQWYGSIGIEKKQGVINKRDGNEVIKTLGLKSFESEFKTMIIWKPERLHHAVGPKLLKIIEEPPPKTLFILVAENQEMLIKTIVSRTQLVRFNKISEDKLTQALLKLGIMDEDKLSHAVKLAQGNYTEAKRLLMESENLQFHSKMLKDWMRLCYKRDALKIMGWVEEMAKVGREKQKEFIKYALSVIRESFLLNYTPRAKSVLLRGDQEFANKFSPFVHYANGDEMVDQLNKAYYGIERNGNPKILFMDLSFIISTLLKKQEKSLT